MEAAAWAACNFLLSFCRCLFLLRFSALALQGVEDSLGLIAGRNSSIRGLPETAPREASSRKLTGVGLFFSFGLVAEASSGLLD